MSKVVNLVPTEELERARDELDICLADVLACWSPTSFERTSGDEFARSRHGEVRVLVGPSGLTSFSLTREESRKRPVYFAGVTARRISCREDLVLIMIDWRRMLSTTTSEEERIRTEANLATCREAILGSLTILGGPFVKAAWSNDPHLYSIHVERPGARHEVFGSTSDATRRLSDELIGLLWSFPRDTHVAMLKGKEDPTITFDLQSTMFVDPTECATTLLRCAGAANRNGYRLIRDSSDSVV